VNANRWADEQTEAMMRRIVSACAATTAVILLLEACVSRGTLPSGIETKDKDQHA